ncbi:hypothetical protein [uncultured Campylobacter sp.]|uniref:hypothetical protein n=1 Tax=uncultured Campylobacter sp. TaxID=218934 RepID=UPI0026109AD3|nr:hypothetical protein [uncultured Campylobacter sp.]
MSAFVNLKSQLFILDSLKKSIDDKDKLILLIGKSGSGKSFLLEHLSNDIELFLFLKPFFNEKEFSETVSNTLFGSRLSFNKLYDMIKNSKKNFILAFDELGMYDEEILERLRLLSELKNLQLILSTHKKQKILEKEHFSSRISKEFAICKLDINELFYYVSIKHSSNLCKKSLKFLAKISLLNLRTVDKILKTFNEIKLYYNKMGKNKKDLFILKLCALHYGLLR